MESVDFRATNRKSTVLEEFLVLEEGNNVGPAGGGGNGLEFEDHMPAHVHGDNIRKSAMTIKSKKGQKRTLLAFLVCGIFRQPSG
jgi:hypothetical protein